MTSCIFFFSLRTKASGPRASWRVNRYNPDLFSSQNAFFGRKPWWLLVLYVFFKVKKASLEPESICFWAYETVVAVIYLNTSMLFAFRRLSQCWILVSFLSYSFPRTCVPTKLFKQSWRVLLKFARFVVVGGWVKSTAIRILVADGFGFGFLHLHGQAVFEESLPMDGLQQYSPCKWTLDTFCLYGVYIFTWYLQLLQ